MVVPVSPQGVKAALGLFYL